MVDSSDEVIEFRHLPLCLAKIRVKSSAAGRSLRCPGCKKVIRVPGPKAPLNEAPFRAEWTEEELAKTRQGVNRSERNLMAESEESWESWPTASLPAVAKEPVTSLPSIIDGEVLRLREENAALRKSLESTVDVTPIHEPAKNRSTNPVAMGFGFGIGLSLWRLLINSVAIVIFFWLFLGGGGRLIVGLFD